MPSPHIQDATGGRWAATAGGKPELELPSGPRVPPVAGVWKPGGRRAAVWRLPVAALGKTAQANA